MLVPSSLFKRQPRTVWEWIGNRRASGPGCSKITIQRIMWFALSTLIRWLVIYPLDSVIWPLNNRVLDGKEAGKGHFVDFPGCCFHFFVPRCRSHFVALSLMTDYYGAFSTSTSSFPGQIQSASIDTSYKSILTCLYNNKKI